MGNKKKQVPLNARKESKQVRIPQQSQGLYPAWRFSTVDKQGPFAWPEGQDTELTILSKLRQFDSMEWRAIEGSNHHSISVTQLSVKAKKRLIDIGQDDIDELFSFRLQGQPRIFCIRDRHVAKLLWYDPKHEVCPSQKKHT